MMMMMIHYIQWCSKLNIKLIQQKQIHINIKRKAGIYRNRKAKEEDVVLCLLELELKQHPINQSKAEETIYNNS